MTSVNDTVLVYYENRPLVFARIEAVDPDVKRGWYHVKLLMLQMPLEVVTWILRDAYINGETFTMNGKEMRLEKIVCPKETPRQVEEPPNSPSPAKGKVISLNDLKKK